MLLTSFLSAKCTTLHDRGWWRHLSTHRVVQMLRGCDGRRHRDVAVATPRRRETPLCFDNNFNGARYLIRPKAAYIRHGIAHSPGTASDVRPTRMHRTRSGRRGRVTAYGFSVHCQQLRPRFGTSSKSYVDRRRPTRCHQVPLPVL